MIRDEFDKEFDDVEFMSNAELAKANTSANLSKQVKLAWQTQSEEVRQRRLNRTYTSDSHAASSAYFRENNPSKDPKKLAQRKQTKLSNGSEKPPEFWQEVYDLFWGENRNSKKLKDKVCKQYSIKPGTLHTLINGGLSMNLPQETQDTHQQRLRQWHEKWGDYRFIYTINNQHFDSLADAGKWFVEENSLPIPFSEKTGKTNYGNVVWGYFNMCKNTSILKKGKYAGWKFIKQERKNKNGST